MAVKGFITLAPGSIFKTFFLTYEWAKTRMERLGMNKHSSLLQKIVNYGRKKVLLHWARAPGSFEIIFNRDFS
jgi:hypothetical protein